MKKSLPVQQLISLITSDTTCH